MLGSPTMITRGRFPRLGAQWQLVNLRRRLHIGRGGIPPQLWAVVDRRGGILGLHARIAPLGASRRSIHIPTVLLPPVVFVGLLVGLWIWYARSIPYPWQSHMQRDNVADIPAQEVRDDGRVPE